MWTLLAVITFSYPAGVTMNQRIEINNLTSEEHCLSINRQLNDKFVQAKADEYKGICIEVKETK